MAGSNIPNTPLLSCRFGNIVVAAQWNSDQLIFCKSPSLLTSSEAGGDVFYDLSVSANLQDWNSLGISFEYLQPVSAFRILPSFGPENSHTAVTIFGTGFFASSSLRCRTGIHESKAVQVISSIMLICIVPPSPAGEMSLFVSPNKLDYQSLGLSFLHYKSPVLESLTPSSGSTRARASSMCVRHRGWARPTWAPTAPASKRYGRNWPPRPDRPPPDARQR